MNEIVNSNFSRTIKLSNQTEMPAIGLGTYKLEPIKESIETAIKVGYRYIDTAKLYKNEKEIGEAINGMIEKKLITRNELYISTKLWNDDHEDPVSALKESLAQLKMDYIDLYVMHWPLGKIENNKIKQIPLYKTWAKLEECVSLGLTRSIGVSNFNVQLLLDLSSYAKILPVTNQIELHPFLTQENLVDFCKMYNIVVVTFNPINKGSYVSQNENYEKFDLFKDSVILDLAKKHGKSPAQVILNWHIYRGLVPIPKSSNEGRLKENLESFNFKLNEDDYKLISAMNINKRFNDPKKKAFTNCIDIFA